VLRATGGAGRPPPSSLRGQLVGPPSAATASGPICLDRWRRDPRGVAARRAL